MKKLTAYFRGVGQEARRVRWPSRSKLWKSVGTVVLVTVIAALVLVLCDLLAANLLSAFDKQKPSSSAASAATVLIDNLKLFGGFIKW